MNSRTTQTRLLAYGPAPDQALTFSQPTNPDSVRGLAVLIHGGYWRSALSAALMEPLEQSLLANGWMVANIEYRRGSGGRWPAPVDDCRQALALAGTLHRELAATGPMIGIGHSVGGQLALLNADMVDAVVALAPVTDVDRTYHEGLGENAASEYFESTPADSPVIYNEASAIRQLPVEVPVLLVHGVNDIRVPVEHSREYLAAAYATGSAVRLLEYEDLGHRVAIDPAGVHWHDVLAWLNDFTVSAAPDSRTPASR